MLISAGTIKKSEFSVGQPSLLKSMQAGIDMTSNYIRLEKKDAPDIFLKVDYEMYLLMNEAERGVPVLFMESDLVKRCGALSNSFNPSRKLTTRIQSMSDC